MAIDTKIMEKIKSLMKNSTVKDNYKCSKCRDLGYIFVKDDNQNEMAMPCSCLAKRRIDEMLTKCGLSEAFKEKTFSSYICKVPQQYKAKHCALKYCQEDVNNKKSLIMCGKSGSGKTHLGIAVMLNLINQGKYCKYMEYNNMIVALKQSAMDRINQEMEMEKILNPSILFIDDFLKGNVTAADLNYIYRIINSRYLTKKPVIISTEKTIDEIISWDEAVGSRLVEMAGDNIITFYDDMDNYRLRNLKGGACYDN